MTERAASAAVSTKRSVEVSLPHPSGIVLRDDHVQVAWFFAVLAVILIAVGILVPFTVHDGPWLAVMTIMGSAIIVALLSAAAVPHLQQRRRH